MKQGLLALLVLTLTGCSLAGKPDNTAATAELSALAAATQTLQVGDQKFHATVARTPAQRQQGLMGVELMPANHGMLFVWENTAPRNFWMKNTLIPLDMIWIDADKTVVDIQAAQPCGVENCPIYSGRAPAQYVLELNQGVLRAEVGDRVEF